MVTRSVLRGYLLEETLAWLLRHSGYELLVSDEQDPIELESHGGDLRVRGRGTTHQVDVLGDFAFTPAFSLPVRLFLEAKFYQTRCRLDVVRNAYGVLEDVNQNFVHQRSSRPRRRFQYCYSLFSASGFSQQAQDFALAHQISLVDLSTPSFDWLRQFVTEAAEKLWVAAHRHGVSTFPVLLIRTRLRMLLETAPADLLDAPATNAVQFQMAAYDVVDAFVADLRGYADTELLLGFPPAPFILPLSVSDRPRFVAYATEHPSHPILIRRTDTEWLASPVDAPDSYQLTFNLPPGVEAWISEDDEQVRRRVRSIKDDFLHTITIYYIDAGILRTCHLRYQPQQLRVV